jgi:hypothetical protein
LGVFGRGEIQKASEDKMSVTKRENEKERRAAWKFDEITNGFKVEARYCFPNPPSSFLKKRNMYIYINES